MSKEASAAADALGAVIKTRNTAQLDSLYAEDIVVWHTASSGKGMGKKENIGLLAGVFKLTSALEYRDIRRYAY
jgi:hypothetical protein